MIAWLKDMGKALAAGTVLAAVLFGAWFYGISHLHFH